MKRVEITRTGETRLRIKADRREDIACTLLLNVARGRHPPRRCLTIMVSRDAFARAAPC